MGGTGGSITLGDKRTDTINQDGCAQNGVDPCPLLDFSVSYNTVAGGLAPKYAPKEFAYHALVLLAS
jgi:hypothetical protein